MIVSIGRLFNNNSDFGFDDVFLIIGLDGKLFYFFTLMAFFSSYGPSLFFSALNVKHRDFRYLIPFLVQIGLYISPVGFLVVTLYLINGG